MNKVVKKKVSLLLGTLFIILFGIIINGSSSNSSTNSFSKVASVGNSLFASNSGNSSYKGLPSKITHFDVEPQSAVTYTKAINEEGTEVVGANANVSAIRSVDETPNQIQYSEDGGSTWTTKHVDYKDTEWQTDHNLDIKTSNVVVKFQIKINETWYTVKLDKDTVYPENTYVKSNVQNSKYLAALGATTIVYNGNTYYNISGIKVFEASNITCPDQGGIDLILSIATILSNQQVNVNVTKTWDGTTPTNSSVTLQLMGVDKENNVFELSKNYTEELSSTNNWKHTFENVSTTSKTGEYILDKFTVVESKVVVDNVDVTEEYTKTITYVEKTQTEQSTNINGTLTNTKIDLYGVDIKNTYTPRTTSVTINKTWNDNNNQDGLRDEYTVTLTGTITVDDNIKTVYTDKKTLNPDELTYTWNNLSKYSDGKEITYTIDETKVPAGYTKNVDGYSIINTHNPSEKSITVNKVWNDSNNNDGIRPNQIEVKLIGKVGNDEVYSATAIIKEENNWTYTFENIPEYNNGNIISYQVSESAIEGYNAEIVEKDNTFILTNTHDKEQVTITGSKIWDDNNNQDGIRANYKVTLTGTVDNQSVYSDEKELSKDTLTYTWSNLDKYYNGKEITYTVDETSVPEGYTKSIDGYNITNTHIPEKISVTINKTWDDNNNQDGIRANYKVTLTGTVDNQSVYSDEKELSKDTLTYTWSNLDKYYNGKEITYTVDETSVPEGYTKSIDGYNITNTHIPEKISVTINKTWDDNNNQDGIRPEEITVNLLANGKILKNQTIKADQDGKWSYTFDNLDKYQNGNEIKYTITENKVDGYETKIDGYDITNTHTPATISLPIEKVWVDGNDQDGIRPNQITIYLFANGTQVDEITMTANEEGKWLHTFTNLPKYNNGTEITYTLSEKEVVGYEVSYENNIIKNTHNPSEKSITINKIWEDSNNNDNLRPNQIEVNLIGKVGEEEVYKKSATITEEDNWTYTFENIPEYNNGNIISYQVSESAIEGYNAEIVEKDNTFILTNTHDKEQVTITGSKIWDDNNNQDGIRPNSIKINLLANGNVVETKEVTPDNDGNWTYTFTKDKYQNKEEISYTLEEVSVDGYTSSINTDSYNITNYHEPETISYTINKNWLDNENNDNIRPESIKVSLYANGELLEQVTITQNDNWTYTFEELPRYADGELIEYTIVEDEIKGYSTTIDYGTYDEESKNITTDINNTHENEQTEDIIINKVWDDNDSTERPDSIEVKIYANNELFETVTLSKENNWTYTLTGLDKYKNGELINYTIEELNVLGYETSYDGYTIINKKIIPYKGGDYEEIPPQTGIDNIDFSNKSKYPNIISYILASLLMIKLLLKKVY